MIINDVIGVSLDKRRSYSVGDVDKIIKDEVTKWLSSKIIGTAGNRQFHAEFRHTFRLDDPLFPGQSVDIYRAFVSAIYGYIDPSSCIDKDDLWYAPAAGYYPVVKVPIITSKPFPVGVSGQYPEVSVGVDCMTFEKQLVIVNGEIIDGFYKLV